MLSRPAQPNEMSDICIPVCPRGRWPCTRASCHCELFLVASVGALLSRKSCDLYSHPAARAALPPATLRTAVRRKRRRSGLGTEGGSWCGGWMWSGAFLFIGRLLLTELFSPSL